MSDILDKVVRILLVALVTPIKVADAAERLLRADVEADHLRRQLDTLRDELRETKRNRVDNAIASTKLADRVADLEGENRLLSSERDNARDINRLLTRERDDYRADVDALARDMRDSTSRLDQVKRSCTELQGEVNTAREQRDTEARDSAKMRESLQTANVRAASWKKFKDHAEEQSNALRTELDAAIRDLFSIRAELASLEESATPNRRQIERLRRETGWPSGVDESWLLNLIHNNDKRNERLTNDVARLMNELTTLHEVIADHRAHLATPAESSVLTVTHEDKELCTWCIRNVEPGWYTRGDWTHNDGPNADDPGPDQAHPMCTKCSQDCSFDGNDVRARAKLRSECCKLRRSVPNPYKICCDGCGAIHGHPCDPARAKVMS